MARQWRHTFSLAASEALGKLLAQVGPIAQWLEQATHNRLVGGSSPSGPTILPLAHLHLDFSKTVEVSYFPRPDAKIHS